MNIFVLNENEQLSAQSALDRHVVKMPTESVQLLCSVHHFYQTDIVSSLMKQTHPNHPCSIWVREHINNYNWLINYTNCLLAEYTFRYNKIHKSGNFIDLLSNNKPPIPNKNVKLINFGTHQITQHPQAIPEQYKQSNVIEAYRLTYLKTKVTDKNGRVMMIYTNRMPPEFLLNKLKFEKIKNKYKAVI